jgi:hypothetical protein
MPDAIYLHQEDSWYNHRPIERLLRSTEEFKELVGNRTLAFRLVA